MRAIFLSHPNKLKICLTKIDEIKKSSDFNKLLTQISSSLSHSFDNHTNSLEIITICLPDKIYVHDKDQNRIDFLVDLISKAVGEKVQQNFVKLQEDLSLVDAHLRYLDQSDCNRKRNKDWLTTVRILAVAVLIGMLTSFSNFVVEITDLWKLYIILGLIVALLLSLLVTSKAYSNQERGQLKQWRKWVETARVEYEEVKKKVMQICVG